MSFSMHDWLMQGFRGSVGKTPDFRIIMNATSWYERSVLVEADLAELQSLIDAKNAAAEAAAQAVEEEPVIEEEEEPVEEEEAV